MSNAMETTPKPSWLRIVLGFLVLSTGLATIFTGVITAWQAWEEHLQEHWPQVTAHVDTCDLQQAGVATKTLPWTFEREFSPTMGAGAFRCLNIIRNGVFHSCPPKNALQR